MCSLLAWSLLLATSQFLAHYHVPKAPAHAAQSHDLTDHGDAEQCSLCLQFDRLPAPPAPLGSPDVRLSLIATIEAERLERLALDLIHLWPPSRGPPLLAS